MTQLTFMHFDLSLQPQEADAFRASEEDVGHDSDLDCLEDDNKLPYSNNEARGEVGGVTVNNQQVGGVCVVSDSFVLNEISDWNSNNNNDQWSSRATYGSQSGQSGVASSWVGLGSNGTCLRNFRAEPKCSED